MVISRRTLLGTGITAGGVAAALVVADLAHRLDDLARAVGVDPKPQPDAGDDRLVAAVAADQNRVLAAAEATKAKHSALPLDRVIKIGREHVEAVGGSRSVPATPQVPAGAADALKSLSATYAKAAKARASDAAKAVSPDLVRVLCSMSAGLAQCARAVGDVR